MSWRGFYPSTKALGRAFFESTLERDLQTLLCANPAIEAYAVQPHDLTYYWLDQGAFWPTKSSYVPDVVTIDRAGRVVVIDAKASFFAHQPRWRLREAAIRRAYEEDHGVAFVVLTEREIRQQPRLRNCEALLSHRAPPDDPHAELMATTALEAAGGGATISEISRALASNSVSDRRAFSAVMRLALAGRAKFDLSQPISLATVIVLC